MRKKPIPAPPKETATVQGDVEPFTWEQLPWEPLETWEPLPPYEPIPWEWENEPVKWENEPFEWEQPPYEPTPWYKEPDLFDW